MSEPRSLAGTPGARFLVAVAVVCGLESAALVVFEALLLSAVVGAVFLDTRSTADVPLLLAAMAGVAVLRLPLTLAGSWFAETAARRVTGRLRAEAVDALLGAGPVAVGRERRGELVSVLVGGLESISDDVAAYLPARWHAVVVPIFVLAVVTLIDPPSTLVLLATGPLLVLLLAVIGGRTRTLTERRFEDMRWLGSFFLDVLQGVGTLKLFGRSAEQTDTIRRLGRRYADSSMEVLRTAFQTSLVLEWGASIAVALVAVEISLRLMTGGIAFEPALAVLVVTPAFFLPLRQLAAQYHVGAAGKAAAARVAAIVDARPADASDGAGGAIGLGGIRFDDVSVAYPGRPTAALDGVSLTIRPRSFVALAGPTGAGKSTLLGLLVRFVEPDAGRVVVDGRDLASIGVASWRSVVAWVPQSPGLVHGSVADNLRLARPAATVEELLGALRDADAATFIAGLPEGLETIVGPGGRGLSGGQVRRLAIARALVAGAPYLLLDEPTADLDAASVAAIVPALERLRGRSTVIIATHDPRLVALADEVVVLDGGRIATASTRRVLEGPRRTLEPDDDVAVHPDAADPHAAVAESPDPAVDVRPSLTEPVEATLSSRRGDLRRVAGLLRPNRRWIALAAVLGFATIASNVALAATSAYLISRAAIVTNVADVALAVTAVRVLAIARSGFRYAERLITHRATFEALTALRAWFYASIEPLAPARLARHRAGDLLARIGADVDTLEGFPARVLLPPIVAVGVVLFGAILLGAFDAGLAVALVAGLVLAGIAVPRAIRGPARRAGEAAIAGRAGLSAVTVDLVTALGDLVVLDRDRRVRGRVLALGRDVDRFRQRGATIRAAAEGSTALVAGLTGVATLAIGVGLVVAGRLDGVFLALVTLAAVACFEAVGPVAQAVEAAPRHQRAAGRLFELVDARPSVVDPPTPAARPIAHDLEIEHLSFRYQDGAPLALDDVSVSVPAGGRLAIVGPSGAGKSTLVNLLLRFWDYGTGEIRIDGRDLHAYRQDDVRGWLGVVDQRVHLFNATIRDNLAVADADATDADMVAACRIAQLHPFIEGLPAGYRTRVGQDGLQLSGGQRQQLAIARIVLKAAPIVVLDEATAHLDEMTERAVLDALEPFFASRTVVVIAHRTALVDRVDRVVRLEAGRIVGGPLGLLRASGNGG